MFPTYNFLIYISCEKYFMALGKIKDSPTPLKS